MSKNQTPLQYVPGANADHDRLLATYGMLEKQNGLPASEGVEVRTPKDVFGLNAKPTEASPLDKARKTSERLNQFLSLLIEEGALRPEEVYYGVELFALCVFNQDPAPLSPEDGNAVRQKAREYWMAATRSTPR